MAKPEISTFMQNARERFKLSQAGMCQKLGVYQSYVSMVEQGRRLLDPVTAAQWGKKMRGISQAEIVQIAINDMFRKHKIRLTVVVTDGAPTTAKPAKVAKKASKKKVAEKNPAKKAKRKYTKRKQQPTGKIAAIRNIDEEVELDEPQVAVA